MRGLCRKTLSDMRLSSECEGVLRGWLVGSREKKILEITYSPLHTPSHTPSQQTILDRRHTIAPFARRHEFGERMKA